MIKRFIPIMLLFVSILFPQYINAQKYTISGYVKDASSKEHLIGASIYDTISVNGAVTNAYGYYSLTLAEGKISLQYSYAGYATEGLDLFLSKDTVINIELNKSSVLSEVSVTAKMSDIGVKGSQMSAIEIPIEQIKAVPALFGEVDLVKALQLLPGVQSGTEGTAGFYVRGGGPDENLVLLDEIPVYNINHAMGIFSIFNADAVKNVVLYKGSFPARYGERLSSVVDIRTKDGDMQKYHGNFSIGLISAKLNVEGPIIKDKTSFSLSARRSYFDIFTSAIARIATEGEGYAGYYFYDVNAKLNHKFSDEDRLYLSFYLGNDGIYMGQTLEQDDEFDKLKGSLKWGNLIASLRWNHIINSKLFMNTTAAFSRYRFRIGVANSGKNQDETGELKDYKNSIALNSGIMDFSVKTDFDYSISPKNTMKFGVGYTLHKFSPEVLTSQMIDLDIDELQQYKDPRNSLWGNELSAYAEDNVALADWLKVNGGLRYSAFLVQKRFYNSLQPRLSMRFLVSDDWSLKAGYSYMSQYIHLLSNSTLFMPTDLWVPATRRVVPLNTHQVTAGVFYNLNKILDFSVEGYYKTMNNVIEYKDGSNYFLSSEGWEDKVCVGRGWSYGVEFFVQKTVGKVTGWLGYTWSKSTRLFDREGQQINFGRPFPAKFDRRHDFKITAAYKISDRIDLSASWLFQTGNATTLALHDYTNIEGYTEEHIESRNNYRLPAYHRLDLGINFNKKKKHGIRTWNISFYNLYYSQNPFMLFTSVEYNQYGESHNTLKQLSLFPIIPSVSYSYRW